MSKETKARLDRIERKLDWLHEAILSVRPALRGPEWFAGWSKEGESLRAEYRPAPLWPGEEPCESPKTGKD